jgi:hypothetical protein
MKDIEGRKDSFIILPDGRNLSPRVLTSALSRFEYYLNIEQFKIVQEKTNLIKIYIEKRKDTLSSDHFIRAIRRHFRREFSFLFRDVEIDIKMQRIKPEKTGKRRAVISKLTC